MLFSVLMSLYAKEHPEFLYRSLQSIWDKQTLKPAEIVLVKDGPLTPELERVISDFQTRTPLKVVALSKNQGLGKALNAWLQACSYDLVARMDTDDISKPERFERQVSVFEKHPEFSLVGAWIEEFIDAKEHIVAVRKVPERHEEIYSFAKSNHPVVMFRKTAVLRCGNYRHCISYEDYYLWVRMLANGCLFLIFPTLYCGLGHRPIYMHDGAVWHIANMITHFNGSCLK